jgi:ubiquinone/menaquinone biosynthesis C-methylase UbiE
MSIQQHAEKIHEYYNNPAIAAGYSRAQYITPCERMLFDAYIKPGMRILDIGVGGGRTSEYIAPSASCYVGIDYAPEMVRMCRAKFPKWEYHEASATDLSRFQAECFDVVVMSYNMLDDLIPDENRRRCLRECYRVLQGNGLLIFSSHNPRAIVVRPEFAAIGSQESSASLELSGRISALLRQARNYVAEALTAIASSIGMAYRYALKAPFWRGEGYMLDCENLMTHFWVPKRAILELQQCGFDFIDLQGDDYPRKSHLLVTEWYYYVFVKSGAAARRPASLVGR